MQETQKNIWIVGCGDIGLRVAKLYQTVDNNFVLNGIVRSEKSKHSCEQQKINTLQIDLAEQAFKAELFAQADLFYFAPPPANSDQDTTLQQFLNKLSKHHPRRIVLISTTGVYGNTNGDWIDESSPLNPVADRAKRRYNAEQSLITWAQKQGVEYNILRVPGIYAADRLPLTRLQKGLPVVKESEAGFTNRIHADDLAQVAKAAMTTSHKNQIYNVTDGNPTTMTDYFNQVADFANLPRPPQISMKEAEQTVSAGMFSYLKESRRIKNDKMMNELKITLIYPTLHSVFN